MAMDLIHKFLNIVLPPITFTIILFTLPPFLLFKFFSYITRSVSTENVAGKVVLITGASSGIGEYLAYEYARRGAKLAIAARRENKLQSVGEKARKLGSPDVLVVSTDVSKEDDCKRFIEESANHFGQLDHLVNNAGIAQFSLLEESSQVSDLAPTMNVNFWGSVYCTHFAIPYLRKSKGTIVAVASVAGYTPVPKLSIYCASKAAVISFFETLRTEVGRDIGVTIVAPGLIESEMAQNYQSEVHIKFLPAESTEMCAKAIVNSACRREKYLTEPSWTGLTYPLKVLFPEAFEWFLHSQIPTKPNTNNRFNKM